MQDVLLLVMTKFTSFFIVAWLLISHENEECKKQSTIIGNSILLPLLIVTKRVRLEVENLTGVQVFDASELPYLVYAPIFETTKLE